MANRTMYTDYNTLTKEEWLAGWNEMQNPGTYERGIFGDLMLPGIACGTRKYLLIFNTNLDTPHDPIYVVDPTNFNVVPDTEIPVVLAYNMSHYESLEPCTDVDVKMSTDLVKQYIQGRYRYKKQDMPYLISNEPEGQEEKFCNEERRKIFCNEIKATVDKEKLVGREKTSSSVDMINCKCENYKGDHGDNKDDEEYKEHEKGDVNSKETEESNSQIRCPKSRKLKQRKAQNENNVESQAVGKKDNEVTPNKKTRPNSHTCEDIDDNFQEDIKGNLFYTMKNKAKEHSIKQVGKLMECPICKAKVKNVNLHLNRKPKCGDKIDLAEFSKRFEMYKKEIDRIKQREDNQKKKIRMLEKNANYYNEAKEKSRKKQAREDPAKKKMAEEETRKRMLEKNANYYNEAKEKSRKKQAREDPTKKKMAEEEIRKRILEKNPHYYKEAVEKTRKKLAREDPAKKKIAEEETRRKMLEKNSNYYNDAMKKTRQNQQANTNEKDRRRNFNLDIIFGPIFICSCCERKCYEKSVTQITPTFKQQVHKKRENFFSYCIRREILIRIELNGNSDKTGSYICSTCKASMLSGKVPSMATINGLFLLPLHEDHYLTELENNMIARNLIFQYIYCLKKSRWAATKKKMVSVPVTKDSVLNTLEQLPRLPSEAGLIEVGFKRKMEYKHSHRQELIDVNKIFEVLKFLKASGHPYYQDFDNFETFKSRCMEKEGHSNEMLFNQADIDVDSEEDTSTEDIEEKENNTDETTLDAVRKHQFDHNRNTAMTNNYPEMSIDENGRKVDGQLFFAPAEGNCPTNLQQEKDWDIKT